MTLVDTCPITPGPLRGCGVLGLAQPSRADRYDGYARTAQLLFQSQRKRGHEGFGCGIGAGKGNGLKACSRGDVNDSFFLPLQHSGKKVVGELNDGFVVEAEHLQLPGEGKIAEFSAETKAGIVDEQVDLNAAVGELVSKVLAGSGGSQIRRKSETRL